MCIGNPRKPVPYLRQTASARLESNPGILNDQSHSEEQSDQPDSWGHSHLRSLLENFYIDDCYLAAPDLWEKAEATVLNSFRVGKEAHVNDVMNPDLARNLVACLICRCVKIVVNHES